MNIVAYDTRWSIREAYPVAAYVMLALLIMAPLGCVPADMLNLPTWYRVASWVSLISFCLIGHNWHSLYSKYVFFRHAKVSSLPQHYPIQWAQEMRLRYRGVTGTVYHFRGEQQASYIRFDDDHERVLFVLSQ